MRVQPSVSGSLGDAAGDVLIRIEEVWGTDFGDVLSAYASDVMLLGFAGADTLGGSFSSDSLFGSGDFDDSLFGGMGRDRLIGGAGADTFGFSYTRESRADYGLDVIVDFESGDAIDLSGIDATIRVRGSQSFTFVGTDALGTAGTLRYENFGTGITVQGDTNGNGNGRADFILQVLDVTTLSAGDFLL